MADERDKVGKVRKNERQREGWMHRGTGTPIRRRDQNGSLRRERRTGERVAGGRGRGQPPVLILIENAFVEKVARARLYTCMYTRSV